MRAALGTQEHFAPPEMILFFSTYVYILLVNHVCIIVYARVLLIPEDAENSRDGTDAH